MSTDRGTPLTSADTLLWRIERDPILRSPVVVVGLLDQPAELDGVRRVLERGCEVFPRLAARITPAAAPRRRPQWQPDPDFDLDFHLRHVRLADADDLAAVLAMVDPTVVEAFDPARPPWQLLLVDGLRDGRAAFVLRFHHAITDGVGGVGLAAELFDHDRAPAPTAPPYVAEPGRDGLAEALGLVGRVVRGGAGSLLGAVRDPVGFVRRNVAMGASVGRLLAPVSAPCSPLLTGRSLGRHLDALEVPLDDLKAAAHAVEASLNDVLLAAVTAGVASYHDAKQVPLARLRVTMPVNLRATGDAAGGNQFAPTRFEVPADLSDPVERVHSVQAIARRARNEPALATTDVLATAIDVLPASAVSRLFGDMLKHVDVDVSNVPGLRRPAYLGGAAIDRMWAFAPPTGAALSVTLLSHLDAACIGVTADAAAVDDMALLGTCLRTAFDDVLALAQTAHHPRKEPVSP